MNLISGWIQRRDEEPKLNAQFFLTLRSNYISLKPEQPDKVQQECMDRIDELFRGVQTWSSAYAIEQLLIHLYKPENLNIEMQRRLIEAERTLHPNEFEKYRELAQETLDIPSRRVLLARMVNDIQWRYTINETRRKYIRITATRTGILFVASVILFAYVYWQVVDVPEYLNLHVAGLVAAASGFLGASFSMILVQRKRLESTSFDDLKVMRRFGHSLPRALVGLGAATILYYMMVCGLIGGLAFPDLTNSVANQSGPGFSSISKAAIYGATGFSESTSNTELTKAVDLFVASMEDILSTRNVIPDAVLRTEARNIAAIAIQTGSRDTIDSLGKRIFDNLKSLFENTLGPTDVALLIVWCFLAGFSEQLVPKLLTNAESKVSPPDSQPSKGSQEITGSEIPGARSGNGAGEEPEKPGPDAADGTVMGSEGPTESEGSGFPEAPQDRKETRPIPPGIE
ncbi:MAG: hypothetical protein L0Y38_11060 [Methylococcaceae bacterium]|nr:hypothetical protein [Methylococcaceae bacterium]MCI0734344.1 hypothetical protein [Methylococcaceae bacterium]